MFSFGVRNKSLFDEWSLVHFTSGYIIGTMNIVGLIGFLGLHTLFEMWENSEVGIEYLQNFGFRIYYGDSKINILGDTISATAGFLVANKVRKW